jgi:hypothetical protein
MKQAVGPPKRRVPQFFKSWLPPTIRASFGSARRVFTHSHPDDGLLNGWVCLKFEFIASVNWQTKSALGKRRLRRGRLLFLIWPLC